MTTAVPYTYAYPFESAVLEQRGAPAMRLATYGPMWLANRAVPGFVQSRQDWIYGEDVTARDR